MTFENNIFIGQARPFCSFSSFSQYNDKYTTNLEYIKDGVLEI